MLNGIYRSIADNDLYGYLMGAGTLDMLAHYYDFPPTGSLNQNSLAPMWDLAEYNYTRLEGREAVFTSFINPMWSKGYSTILNLNFYIDNMSASAPMADTRRDLLLGEAYGLRAMLHLDLLRTFGSHDMSAPALPYHDKGAVVLEPYETSGTAFLGEVMKDLEKAEKLLKANDPILSDQSVNDRGDDSELSTEEIFARKYRNKRMNYWAVQMHKARVNMLLGNYGDVLTITQAIMDEAVDADYSSYPQNGTLPVKAKPFGWTPLNNDWRNNAILYDEVIFGVTQTEQRALYKAVSSTTQSTDPRARVMIQTNLFANIIGIPVASDLSMVKDLRIRQYYQAPMLSGNIGPMTNDDLWISFKYSDQTSWNATVSRPGYTAWMIRDMRALIRLSEAAYMNAEARLRQDDTASAIAMINSVLARRGFQSGDGNYSSTNLLPATATAAEVKDMLDHEMYREFYGEGQVWFYLKRNGETSIIKGNGNGKVNMASTAIYKLPLSLAETDFYTDQK